MKRALTPLMLFLMIALAVPTSARVLRVPGNYETIGAAIAVSRDNDTILVADGEYTGDGNIELSLTRAVVMMSENGPLGCIINVNGGADSLKGISLGARTVLDGFTIKGATNIGIRIENSNPFLIRHCLVTENAIAAGRSQQGAGIFINGSTGRIEHSVIKTNSTINSGAGLYVTASTVDMFDCVVMGNASERFGGGMLYTGSAHGDIRNCVFASNNSVKDGGGFSITTNSDCYVANCTFMDNVTSTGGGGGLYKGSTSNPEIINSIFFGNDAGIGQPGDNLWAQNNGGQITISYSAVEGGPGQNDNWEGDNIITDDPMVFPGRIPEWGEDGFFLDPESPCIDAGSGTAAENGMDTLSTNVDLAPDTGTVDMGYHYDRDNFRIVGILRGYVRNASNDRPLEGATITTTKGQSALSDNRGFWTIPEARIGGFDITCSQLGFNDSSYTGQFLEENATLAFDFYMLHPVFSIELDSLGSNVPPGDSVSLDFSFTNVGNGPLDWVIKKELPGEANADPWELRRSYDVSELTQDPRIEGVVLADGNFYVAGGGRPDSTFIYVIDLDGTYISRFPQPVQERNGLKDLEWDGEWLWGVNQKTVYGMTLDGIVQISFPGPAQTTEAIAWDDQNQILWTSGIIGNQIFGYNRSGQEVGRISQFEFRVFGLAYYPEDPDGHNLYVLHSPDLSMQMVHKIDVINDDTMFVAKLEIEGKPRGCYISNRYDAYSWVFICATDNGNTDRVDVWHLAGNTSWMSIAPVMSGSLLPWENQNLTLTLNATGLKEGSLAGDLAIEHNAMDQEWIIWLWMTVKKPDTVDAVAENTVPDRFDVTGVYPNPFNSNTTLSYSIPRSDDVNIKIFDLMGREVHSQIEGHLEAGSHHSIINAESLSSGIYLCRVEAGVQSKVVKLVLLR